MHKHRTRINYACSFCGKNQDQVQRLIAGPGGVYICDECIDAFSKVNAEPQEESGPTTKTEKTRTANRCSFCGKNQQQVVLLHVGPGNAQICDECIDLCQEIIEEERSTINKPPDC